MDERVRLMRTIQMYDFILYDIKLFLDTHPDSKEALATHRKYTAVRNSAWDEYSRLYGPIVSSQAANGKDRWDWVDAPWPWERSAN